MAGGKLTPRQKMINMMYLVLTALLALNVSREVMDAFYDVMTSQQTSIATVEKQNGALYAAFENAARENPKKAGPWRDKANDVKKESDELYDYIEALKDELVVVTGGEDPNIPGKPKAMDNKAKVANYMILDKKGEELKVKINAYRDKMSAYTTSSAQLQEAYAQIFNTSDVKNRDGITESWEKNRFEHYPLIAVMTFLTGMQADVKTTEANTIEHLMYNIDASDLKFTGVTSVVNAKSNFVTQGDFYEAEVFLAAYDETQNPEIVINGETLSPEHIVNGKGVYKIKTSAAGEKKWAGMIKIKQGGEIKEYPISGAYNVSPPSVVISPSKLNVLYRNVDNPLEIGVPGVDPARIRVSGPGISKSGGGWSADVTSVQGKEMTITVTVVDDEGKVKQTQSKLFRIKGLPQAEGSILRKSQGQMSAGLIKNGKIEASYPDFPYDLSLEVVSFEVKIEGYPPAKITGNTLDGTNKARIDGLKPGQSVTIRNIVAKTQRGDRISNVGAISLDVN